MGRMTPAAGEAGFAPVLPGPFNPMPVQTEAPGIERIASVRILRGSPIWRGMALRLANGAGEDERFELALTAGDGRSVTVAVADREDAVALWRDSGRVSGLPLLLETGDGTVSEPYPQIGRVSLGPVRIRRRHAFMNGRRPRFLVRRKPGRPIERPVIVAGERLTD